MTTRTYGPREHGARPTHVAFFRYGELALLFRKPGASPDDSPRLDDIRRVVDDALKKAGARLSPEDPFTERGRVRTRTTIPIERTGKGSYRFVVANLEHWRPDLEQSGGMERYHREIEAAIGDVPKAVAALEKARLSVDGWRLVSASPNWTALPLCWWGGGGPGGRPVPIPPDQPELKQRRFRPDDVAKAVHAALERIGGGVATGVRTTVKVAILDTWPMEREPGLPPGVTPSDPLGKIATFLNDHPQAHSNDLLQKAAAGDLVPPDRIFDYVSWQPPSQALATHLNWHIPGFEPAYDMSDHGLFIAGMIKDIAPDAEISVYRVLHDDGSGDYATITQAFHDAIRHAEGQPLVINMSLGFAPPLEMIDILMALNDQGEARNAVDLHNAQQWVRAMKQRGTTDAQRARDPHAVTAKLAKAGVVRLNKDGRVTGFAKSLAQVDNLFQVPSKQKVFVVAAAGNDSNGRSLRFGPRVPAAIQGILGVSAARADYSNYDDTETIRDDGVSAYGGLARHDTASDTMVTGQGPVGIAVTSSLPPVAPGAPPDPAHPNTDGAAQWAGTSFAAPVASGLAACIWAANPALGINKLLQAIAGVPGSGSGHPEIGLQQQ